MKKMKSFLLKPFVGLMRGFLPDTVRAMTGMLPIAETQSEDVFIVGFPKSGNTWFQNLVSGIVYGADPTLAPDTLIQELVPDVHTKLYYRRFATPTFFKSHYAAQPTYKRVVYLLRDGRDAMVSYFNFKKKAVIRKSGQWVPLDPTVGFKEFIECDIWPCKWHEHVESWLRNPYHAQMITIRYEDLLENTARELRRFCDFTGIHAADEQLATIASKAAFSQMRQKEASTGWSEQWTKGQTLVRRGKAGSYKDEMPAEALDAMLQEAGPTLTKCGYA